MTIESTRGLVRCRTGLGMPLIGAMLSVIILGCGDSDPGPTVVISRKPIAVKDLPAPILKAARKSLTKVNFLEAWRNQDREGTTISFELRGKTGTGKIRDVRIAATGEILETE